jgi:hypothetical protein
MKNSPIFLSLILIDLSHPNDPTGFKACPLCHYSETGILVARDELPQHTATIRSESDIGIDGRKSGRLAHQ